MPKLTQYCKRLVPGCSVNTFVYTAYQGSFARCPFVARVLRNMAASNVARRSAAGEVTKGQLMRALSSWLETRPSRKLEPYLAAFKAAHSWRTAPTAETMVAVADLYQHLAPSVPTTFVKPKLLSQVCTVRSPLWVSYRFSDVMIYKQISFDEQSFNDHSMDVSVASH